MRRGLVLATLALLSLGAGAWGWRHHYGSSPALAVIGLAGPRADTGRNCQVTRRQTVIGWVPLNWERCFSRDPVQMRPWLNQDVTLRALTRRITHAQHAWGTRDSADWHHAQDSVIAAWRARGGQPITCGGRGARPRPPITRRVEHWVVAGTLVRLIGSYMPPDTTLPAEVRARLPEQWRRSWHIQLDAYPELPAWCSEPQPA